MEALKLWQTKGTATQHLKITIHNHTPSEPY